MLLLLGQGHEAKSAAAALGLSVHTINEHLREARRKLGVTSSRAAARLLIEGHEKLGTEQIGVPGPQPSAVSTHERHGLVRPARLHRAWGAAIVLIFATALAFWSATTLSSEEAADTPRVVATTPASGTDVPAGPFTLSVTFDRPMKADSYSFVQTSAETFPVCGMRKPAQSSDGRTFALRCIAQRGRRYEVWFNRAPYLNFRDLDGASAAPHQLRFGVR